MTYDTERVRVGRKPVTIVEIDLDKCANTYGVAPCTAALSAGSECYNARQHCQDVPNYNNTTVLTHKFSDRHIDGETYIDCITTTALSPTAITPGQPFNRRASITITLQDFPHHDRGIDPYVDTRSYTPENQGTYFGKLLARNPFFQGRPLRLKTGYVADPFSASDLQTENYIIENITFGKKGKVIIVAKDILKLADDERSVCPVASTGKLVADITSGATTLTVTNGTESEYASEYIRVGDEIIYAPNANRTVNVFANLTRGSWNTTASAHSLGDAVQECKHISAVNVVDIITDLLTNYTPIVSGYIPTADWTAEKDTWLSGHTLTALITEPTGVKTLLDEISEQIMVYIWWDAKNQEIKLKAIAPPVAAVEILDEDEHIIGDVDVKVEPDDRKSRVLVFYKPRNPIKFKEAVDFDGLYGGIDADIESADKYNDVRIKIIYARWITSDSIAVTTASRTASQFKAPPKFMSFTMDAKDNTNVTGDYININTKHRQNFDGSNLVTLAQILSVEEITRDAPGTHYRYIAQQAQFSGRYARIMDAGATSVYSSASDAEKAIGCYIVAAGLGGFSDDGEAYRIA